MNGLYSALVAMAFTQVAWLAKVGVVLGLLLGGVLAYVPIARVLRAQGEAPQALRVRRLATVCCLVWGLLLPTSFAVAGLLWGSARGLGNVVEGPVSTTVRATAETWLTRANGLRAGVLARYPLTKRLSEVELDAVVRAAPQWLSEVMDHHEAAATWQRMGGVNVPPAVVLFVREELHRLAHVDGTWLRPAIERLRKRAQGTAGERPTLQETIEAMVAPSVFQDASATIRGRAGHYVWLLVLVALGVSAALAGALRLSWKRPAPEAPRG